MSVTTFGVAGWAAALHQLVERGRYRSLEIRKVDGEPVRQVTAAAPEHWSYNLGDGEASFWVP